MTYSTDEKKNIIKKEFKKLLTDKIDSLVITNKYKLNSKLAQKNHIFSVTVLEDEIHYIKNQDHYKNKMKFLLKSDTVLYRDELLDDHGKTYFFSTLFTILNEIKKQRTWIIKNKKLEYL